MSVFLQIVQCLTLVVPFTQEATILCICQLQTHQHGNSLQVTTEIPALLEVLKTVQELCKSVISFFHVDRLSHWNGGSIFCYAATLPVLYYNHKQPALPVDRGNSFYYATTLPILYYNHKTKQAALLVGSYINSAD